MSVDIQSYGGFRGTKRQGLIHYRLFSLLSGFDGRYTYRNGSVKTSTKDEMIFSWLIDVKSWSLNEEGWIFASLARALPGVDFSYETQLTSLVAGPDQSCCYISYNSENGKMSFLSEERRVMDPEHFFIAECPNCGAALRLNEDEAFEDTYECPECGEVLDLDELDPEEEIDDDAEEDYDESSYGVHCKADGEGHISDNDELFKECLKSEKEKLSDLLSHIKSGTDDPAKMMDIGMIYETGLAGVKKNLTLAWDCYLKAAEMGDENAVKFVSDIFADGSRAELHELLQNKSIGKDVFPVFFDLAQKANSAELTAELLEYKNSLGE